MTKKQAYLIGILFSILLFSFPIFRSELLWFPNRPRINAFFENYGLHYIISLSVVLFGYFLAKLLNFKFWKVITFFISLEILYFIILNYSFNILPQGVKKSAWFGHFKGISINIRPMIQFESSCSQYDSVLFYTLKPGIGNFRHHEFNVDYKINSLGLRDNETDIKNPYIITIGDSFTLGWGVDQDSTFSEILEKKTNKKVLNMGVSSYGTAREAIALERINTDSTKLIILQFHDTDLRENNYFVKNNKLGNNTQLDFDMQVKNNDIVKKYYPFKFIKSAIIQIVTPTVSAKMSAELLGGEYKKYPNYLSEFYLIIDRIQSKFKGKILITYLGSFNTEPYAIDELENYAKTNKISGLYFLNLGGKLNETDYFYLDDHINNNGHKKVANLILQKINAIKP